VIAGHTPVEEIRRRAVARTGLSQDASWAQWAVSVIAYSASGTPDSERGDAPIQPSRPVVEHHD
jgi:hypothetical protein